MSASCAKSPQGRRLVRKSVPDGSSDFQRVLDQFLSSDSDDSGETSDDYNNGAVGSETESPNKSRSKYKYIVASEKAGDEELDNYNYYDDDFEDSEGDSNPQDNHEQSSRVIKKTRKSNFSDSDKVSPRKNEDFPHGDHNNNTSKSICTCGRDQASVTITCTDFDANLSSPQYVWGKSSKKAQVSPHETLIFCHEENSDLSDLPRALKDKRHSLPLKLPSITAHLLPQPEDSSLSGMGSNCSANIGDTREFSSVLSEEIVTAAKRKKSSRMGAILNKHSTSLDKSVNSNDSPGKEHCSCEHHDDGKKTIGNNNKTGHNDNAAKDSSSSGQTKISKRSSSLPGKGSSKTAGSTPQRLLTSRNRSPNGYPRSSVSLDAGGDMRTRSHSWSNGRCISRPRQGPIRPITKNSSLFPRTLVSGPGGMRSHHPFRQPEEIEGDTSTSFSSTQIDKRLGSSSTSSVTHMPGCPLFVPPELALNPKKKLTINETNAEDSHDGNLDADLLPMQRPRAASESQTSRKVRLKQDLLDLPRPRSKTMSEGSHAHSPSSDLDHGQHVHWADEEQGLSLSTSVLLTSIRPRSYSHGAVDGRPHRPILKKVAGL
ncbi:hypothetical protein ElyMa_003649700 [Elysia marginata]|uniref:Uncharacterized protein n=1 Tax=Elysia marginata TaxID=1093978 RepID=A0AAV4EWM1_9GAST|nr:hypothetical protein ElyMa_003649700 [Elysia marginata]